MEYGLGDTVENFELTNYRGETRSLSAGLAQNNVMLVFFRGFW